MSVEEHDLVIVGGGGAGLRAAIAAAETAGRALNIALVSKVYPMRSHTVSAEGGAAAAIGEGDSEDGHAYDTIKGSDYLANQEVVQYFVHEAIREVIRLEHWGCPWSREPDGRPSVRPFGGMTTYRTLFAADKTGFHLLHAIFQTSLKYNDIRRYDEHFVTTLLLNDNGECCGVVAIDIQTGEFRTILGKAVLLATGGLGRVFPFTTNAAINTGDGMALAYRAGVPLRGMEFVQYHPTGLPGTGILITEGARGEGGYLINAKGERFLTRYTPTKMELGPRDIISRAEITEFEAGNGFQGPYGEYMHLDLRHLGEEKIERKIPMVRELARDYVGIDPVHEPIPVRPVVHYMMGGVDVTIDGQTNVPGLYAAGECANVGLNGANRLGSNSLTEILVFGARMGQYAAQYISDVKALDTRALVAAGEEEERHIRQTYLTRGRGNERVSTIRKALQKTMEAGAGVYRSEESLQATVDEVARIKQRFQNVQIDDMSRVFNTELVNAIEMGFMIDCAEAIAQSALLRTESRGAHARRDYPNRDDENFLKDSLAYRTEDQPRVEYRDVNITKWQPEERKY